MVYVILHKKPLQRDEDGTSHHDVHGTCRVAPTGDNTSENTGKYSLAFANTLVMHTRSETR